MSAGSEPGRPPGRTTHHTASARETEALGAALAAELSPGDVVTVHGEMGAGKTTFVRGACRALGVTTPVTSPTFTLARRYEARPDEPPDGAVSGPVTVSHLDLHRLGDLALEDPGLLAEYLTGEEIAFVEWPEVAEGTLGAVVAHVRLAHAGHDTRTVVIERV